MLNFRQFELGPDPFGRKWQVWFKWMQTAISLRHSDTVDVKFILESEGTRTEKTIALPLPDLLALSKKLGREITDPWCCRLAAEHLKYLVETAEDMEKDLVTVIAAQLEEHARTLGQEEEAAVAARR